jgi:peptide/nickel transport system permease protein
MGEYIVRRVTSMIPVLFISSIISFGLLYVLPGDPAVAVLGDNAGNKATYEALRHDLGLDKPVYVQYAKWLGRVAHGNLGTSVRTNEPVTKILLRRLPVSLYVGFAGLLVGVVIGLTAAIISALRPGSRLDVGASVFALGGIALPSFWQALIFVYVFAVTLHWVPPSGYTSPFVNLPLSLKQLALPAIVLGTHSAAVIMRQGRSALIEVLGQDYIATARAKGLAERRVIVQHALKNAFIPIVTIIGLQTGQLVSGAAIVETVFAIPGVGRAAVDAIANRDYPLLQGAVLMLALAVMVANLVTDLTYGYLDPRIRYR